MKLFYSREIHSIQFYSLGKSFTIQRSSSRLSWSLLFILIKCFAKATFSLRLPTWSLFFYRHISFLRLPLLFWHLPNNSFNIHAILVNHCRSVLVVTLIQTFISMLSTVYQISLLCYLTEIPQNTEQLIFSFCFDLALHTTYCTRKKKAHCHVFIWKIYT